MKTLGRGQWRRFGIFIVSFERILDVVPVIPLLLTLNRQILAGLNFLNLHIEKLIITKIRKTSKMKNFFHSRRK